MESVPLKQLFKIIIVIAVPLALLLLLFFDKPVVALAYLIGIFLGIFRLKALFNCVIGLLDTEPKNKNVILIIRYLVSFIISIGVLGFTLYKSQIVGFPVLFGLITVPIIIMIYAIWKGISLYRKS